VRPLLEEYAEVVREREAAYGPPAEHWARTVAAALVLLPGLFARDPTPEDWGKLMILDKLARDAHSPRRDNLGDVAGYAAGIARVREP
jgi:hypothetical protein